MTDETINAEQCAELLHCTEQRIEELTRSGELPGMKFGRGWIYVKADLLAYIADRARKEAEERRQDLNADQAAAADASTASCTGQSLCARSTPLKLA